MRDGRQGEERERLERKPNHVCPSGSRMNAARGSWYIGTVHVKRDEDKRNDAGLRRILKTAPTKYWYNISFMSKQMLQSNPVLKPLGGGGTVFLQWLKRDHMLPP